MRSTMPWNTACFGAAVALVWAGAPIRAEQPRESQPDITAPDQYAITEQRIFAELVAHNQIRSEALLEYTAVRTYQISQPNGKVHAQIEGRMEFHAPDRKIFVVTAEQGSGLVRRLALNPLIATEIKTAAGKDRHDSAITPSNYRLELIGEEVVRSYRCYVLRAIPKRADKYLFDGKLWVDGQDFAIVKIEGRPAATLSFWIRRAEFVREYQKVDGFWLPMRDKTLVEVRLYGKKVLTIEHRDYTVRGDYRTDAGERALPVP